MLFLLPSPTFGIFRHIFAPQNSVLHPPHNLAHLCHDLALMQLFLYHYVHKVLFTRHLLLAFLDSTSLQEALHGAVFHWFSWDCNL